MTATVLNVTSCMAGNAESTCRAIALYIGQKLGIETASSTACRGRPVKRFSTKARYISAGYAGCRSWKADTRQPVELCAVPVMRHGRYGNEAVYFSDVVVRRESRFKSFADLRGASWTYNEPRSHSGYNVVRHHLSRLGATQGYFGKVTDRAPIRFRSSGSSMGK